MNKNTPTRIARSLLAAVAVVSFSACTTAAPQPGSGKKVAANVPVKATAYSYGAKCNGAWAKRNAIGGKLKTGEVSSAAADWSRFPVGTKFRVKETGKVYIVDDFGSAMVGKDKVDLYMPDYGQVYRWGVRNVTLEIEEWGSHAKSLDILKPRATKRYGYVKRMVEQLEAKLTGRGMVADAG